LEWQEAVTEYWFSTEYWLYRINYYYYHHYDDDDDKNNNNKQQQTITTTTTSEYWLFYVKDEASYYELQVDGYVKGDDGSALYVLS